MSEGFGEPQGPHDHSDDRSGTQLRPADVLVVPEYNSTSQGSSEQGSLIGVGGEVYSHNGSQYTMVATGDNVPPHTHNGPKEGGSTLGTSANNVDLIRLKNLSGGMVNQKTISNVEGSALTVSGSGDLRVQSSGVTPPLVDTGQTFSWSTRQQFGGGMQAIGNITDRHGSIVYDGSSGELQNTHLQHDTLDVVSGSALSGGGTGSLGSSVQLNVAQNGISNRELDLGITPQWTGKQTFKGGLETGTLSISQDSGMVNIINEKITSTPTAGTQEGYSFNVNGESVATVYSEANGTGGIQNKYLKVPTSVGYMPRGTPTAPSSGWKLYTDSADSSLKAIKYNGSVTTIAS